MIGGIVMNKLVVAYYRSSSTIQENSIGIQKPRAFNKALELGIAIDLHYTDEFVSARKLKMHQRPGMDALINQITSKNVGRILVYKRDRIARKADEYLQFYYLCKDNDVEVIFTSGDEKALTYDYMGEFLEHIMAGFVELEGDNIHQRHLQAQKSKFDDDNLYSQLPYGYYMEMEDKKKIYRDEPKLQEVKIIFQEVLNRNHSSLNDLCKYLNEELKWKREISKGKRKGEYTEWKVSHLEKILHHPLYIGSRVMIIGEVEMKRPFENLSIIDKELWLEASDIAISMQQSRGRFKPDSIFLLHELLFCSKCNNTLKDRIKEEPELGETIEFYTCLKHREVYFLKDELESFILEQVRIYAMELVNKHWSNYVKDGLSKLENKANFNINNKSQKIASDYEKTFNLIENWIASDNSESTLILQSQLMSSYDQIDAAEKELQNIRLEESSRIFPFREAPDVIDLLTDFDVYRYLINKPDTQLRHLINSVIEKIIVDIDGEIKEIIMKSPFYMSDEERTVIICPSQ